MPNKLISIIIPTYNREKYIAGAIDSILSQDYPNKEIIVMDDGSTDNTHETVKKYDDKIKYFYQANSGVSAARNAALANAAGDYIAWLDSDDYYEDGKLTAQVKYLNEHPEAQIVFVKYENFVDGKTTPAIETRLSAEIGNRYQMTTSLAMRNLFDEIDAFDVKYKIGEDIDWLYRAKVVYGKNLDHYIDIPYYKRRFHNSNLIISEPLDRNFSNRIMMENIKKKRMINL